MDFTLQIIIYRFLVFFVALLYSIKYFIGAVLWYLNKVQPETFTKVIDPASYKWDLIIALIGWSLLFAFSLALK